MFATRLMLSFRMRSSDQSLASLYYADGAGRASWAIRPLATSIASACARDSTRAMTYIQRCGDGCSSEKAGQVSWFYVWLSHRFLHRAKWGGSDYGRYLLLPLPIRLPS